MCRCMVIHTVASSRLKVEKDLLGCFSGQPDVFREKRMFSFLPVLCINISEYGHHCCSVSLIESWKARGQSYLINKTFHFITNF